MIDATDEVSHVDKTLGGYIVEQFKPCVLVVNKWDLAKDRAATDDYGDYLHETLPGLDFAPIAFTTATQNRNVQAVIDVASALFKQARTRVTTSELNDIVDDAMNSNPPKPKHGAGPVKIFYATQVAVCPPTIAMFINDPAPGDPGLRAVHAQPPPRTPAVRGSAHPPPLPRPPAIRRPRGRTPEIVGRVSQIVEGLYEIVGGVSNPDLLEGLAS